VTFAKQLAAPDKADKPADKPADTPAPTITLSEAELDAWVGAYRETKSGSIAKVRREGKDLVVEAGEVIPLLPTSKQAFRLGPTPFTITFAGTRGKRTAILKLPKEEQTFVEVTLYKPQPKELAAVAGRYWSAELNVVWTIRVDNGVAKVDGPNIEGAALEFSSATAASNSEVDIALTFANRGFAMTSGGLRGLRFEPLSAVR
jgi:hypothetical protein